MNMLYGLKESHLKLIQEKISLNPKIIEVILFGSRAKNAQKPGSDIDLAIKGDGINLKDIIGLHRSLEELNLAYKFDLVIFNHIKETALIEHINRVGKILFRKYE